MRKIPSRLSLAFPRSEEVLHLGISLAFSYKSTSSIIRGMVGQQWSQKNPKRKAIHSNFLLLELQQGCANHFQGSLPLMSSTQ